MDTPSSISERRNSIISKDRVNENNKNDAKLSSRWLNYKNIQINAYYFKRGLLLVKTKRNSNSIERKENFHIKDREFFFATPEYRNSAASDKTNSPDARFTKRTKNLLTTLTKFASTNKETASIAFDNNNSIAIFNKRHREEIFLPLILNTQQQTSGLYVYPWRSKNDIEFNFSGFSQFVTAGCLFGSRLKGKNKYEAARPLIKHDIQFYAEEKIESIKYESERAIPYEQMLFIEFEKLCCLIDALSHPDRPKKLLFHVPYYDYILFGIELFIRGRITLNALDELFDAIFAKREEYLIKINEMCEKHDIEVKIESPFENLFGVLDNQENIAEAILSALNLSCDEISPTTDPNECKEKESKLVKDCLTRLQNNRFNETHRQVWQDFGSIDNDKIDNLEALFKMANAIMVALAAKGKNDYETCSLLPLSEKQIQVSYDTTCKKIAKTLTNKINTYNAVFNITILEPLLTYSPTTQGLMFYFADYLGTLSELITDKKLLQYAHENISLFSSKTKQKFNKEAVQLGDTEIKIKPKKLDQILGESISPPNLKFNKK